MTHSWAGTIELDRNVCIDCDTVRWRRYTGSDFEHFLYRVPGDVAWSKLRPDCAAVAADRMRTDGGVL